MAMKVYIKANDAAAWIENTTVYDITVNLVMNAISSASFRVPDIHLDGDATNRLLWDAKIDIASVKITGESDYIVFIGQITKVVGDRHLTIECKSSIDKLKWYQLNGDITNFNRFEGVVSSVASEVITIEDKEGEPATLTIDEEIGNYAIVSDNTFSINTKNIHYNTGGAEIVGVGKYETIDINESGDYDDVEYDTPDGTPWSGMFNNSGTNTVSKFMTLEIDMGNAAYCQILKASTITTIDIKVGLSYELDLREIDSINNGASVTLDMIIGDDATPQDFKTVRSWTRQYNTNLDIKEWIISDNFSVGVGEFGYGKFFNKGAVYYEGMYVGFRITTNGDSSDSSQRIKWQYLTLDINYETPTYDLFNEAIVDNTADTITMTTDVAALGVAIGDVVQIGYDLNEAFAAIKVSIDGVIPDGLPTIDEPSFDEGIATSTRAISGYKLLRNLSELKSLEIYQIFDGTDTVYLQKEEDIVNDGGTLTGFDVLKEWESNNQKYGSVAVWWSGQSEGENPVLVYNNLDDPNPKTFSVVRKDILTYATAKSLANDLIVKYEKSRPSIPLSFSTWKQIIAGFRYDFTLNGESYPDGADPKPICRRVTYHYNEGKYNIIAYLGGGSTPAPEAIGMAIGKLDKRITDIQSVELTAEGLSANNWAAITGKPSTFIPSVHNNTKHSETYTTAATAIAAVNAAGTSFPDAVKAEFGDANESFIVHNPVGSLSINNTVAGIGITGETHIGLSAKTKINMADEDGGDVLFDLDFGTDTLDLGETNETRDLAVKIYGTLAFTAGAVVGTILDEDDLVSDSATALATQQSIKAYVDAGAGAIAAVEAAGLALNAGKVYSSVAEAGRHSFGRLDIVSGADYAVIGYRGFVDGDDEWVLKVNGDHELILNANAGQKIFFSVEDATVGYIDNNGLTLSAGKYVDAPTIKIGGTAITATASEINKAADGILTFPAFLVGQNNSHNILNNTLTTLQWNFEETDLGGNFSSNKFTAPIDGFYHFDVTVLTNNFAFAAGERFLFDMYKNGAYYKRFRKEELQDSETMNLAMRGSIGVELSATDEIEVKITQNTGLTITLTSNEEENHFSGFLVRKT